MMFTTLAVDPPFLKKYSHFVDATSNKAKNIMLKSSREYTVSVMEEGIEDVVEIGTVKTWPSGYSVSNAFTKEKLRRLCK